MLYTTVLVTIITASDKADSPEFQPQMPIATDQPGLDSAMGTTSMKLGAARWPVTTAHANAESKALAAASTKKTLVRFTRTLYV